MAENQKHLWMVRADGEKYTENYLKGGFVGIGWDIGDVKNKTIEEIKKGVAITHPDYTPVRVGLTAGMIDTFTNKIQVGDYVITPQKTKNRFLLGEFVEETKLFENPDDGCEYNYRRKVKWIKQVRRSELPKSTLNATFAMQSVYNLDLTIDDFLKTADDLELQDKKVKYGETLEKSLKELLMKINPKEFEHFIANILNVLGFEGVPTQYIGDGGVDFKGTLDIEGMMNIPLKVQVKRFQGNVSGDIVNNLRGTLEQDENGMIITTGKFTKSAVIAANKQGLKTISLVDGEKLSNLILRHFSEIDEKYREYFGLTSMIVMIK